MREYSVFFDGQGRKLKYTIAQREWIEDQFRRPDGTPGSLGALVQGHLVQAGSLLVQATIVAAGLSHLGKKWDVDRVKLEYEKASKAEGVRALNTAAFKAILASGVLGKVVEDDEPEEGEGKEDGETSTD